MGFLRFSFIAFLFCFGSLYIPSQSLAHMPSSIDRGSIRNSDQSLDRLHEVHEQFEELPLAVQTGLLAWFKKWGLKYDPRLYISNIYRAYYIEENDHFREGMKDIIFLFTLSHPLETLSGPVITFFGISYGFTTEIVSLAVIGYIISIPGLDPLCMILSGSYLAPEKINLIKVLTLGLPIPKVKNMKWVVNLKPLHDVSIKPYRRAVNGSRKFVWGGVSQISGWLRLPEAFEVIFPKLDRLEFAHASLEKALRGDWAEIVHHEDGSIEYRFLIADINQKHRPEIRLLLRKNSYGYFLSELSFKDMDSLSEKEIKALKKRIGNFRLLFGHNVSLAIRASFKQSFIHSLQVKRFYVENVLKSEGLAHWTFKAGALHTRDPRRFAGAKAIEQLWQFCAKARGSMRRN